MTTIALKLSAVLLYARKTSYTLHDFNTFFMRVMFINTWCTLNYKTKINLQLFKHLVKCQGQLLSKMALFLFAKCMNEHHQSSGVLAMAQDKLYKIIIEIKGIRSQTCWNFCIMIVCIYTDLNAYIHSPKWKEIH